jgi:hypothetical protein
VPITWWGDIRRKPWVRMGRGRQAKTGSPQLQDKESAMNSKDGRGYPFEDHRSLTRNIQRDARVGIRTRSQGTLVLAPVQS